MTEFWEKKRDESQKMEGKKERILRKERVRTHQKLTPKTLIPTVTESDLDLDRARFQEGAPVLILSHTPDLHR